MPKKILRRDTEMSIPSRGIFPDTRIPMPKSMNVKPYRSRNLRKDYGEVGGDIQVIIKKQNPRPKEIKILNYSEKQKLVKKMLDNPRKYAKLS